MKIIMLIVLVSTGSCTSSKLEFRATFPSMEQCIQALQNARINENAIAVCVPDNDP